MEKKVKNSDTLKQRYLDVIAFHFGKNLADLYAKFYADKSDDVVKNSVEELLREYLGKKEANLQIKKLSCKV
ncbi:hypothetical protein GW765_00965 [Candidatus Parcubacteria bacterium]|uniref:Uncharacterized protein n=1 Tax=Candidatus Magasanikbacteria bacterium CG10_big_fil_rev_8_21_14_0_10_38_6 TaxID=1974647 RepID=A0A2M6P0Q7_9BACT|nr:hypothetical protein [Candidatus Parcubacteria bacterium]PIR76980.1 MAG: hypothetical protein COU30_04955 [Candidatus Magasanikbacteria bacterium CG10_big_fil_rev_8_21_14_0_10_38_6]